MKKTYFIYFNLCLCLLLAGQPASIHAQPKEYPASKSTIKWSPLVLMEPDGGLQFGYERLIAAHTSLQLEGAYLGFSAWSQSAIDMINNNAQGGYAIKPQIRFYLDGKNEGPEGFYLAVQGMYKHMRYTNDSKIDFYSFELYKDVVKLNFLAGYQLLSKSGFVLDLYGGLGYRHLAIRSATKGWNAGNAWANVNDIGFGNDTPNLAFGFKLGYGF